VGGADTSVDKAILKKSLTSLSKELGGLRMERIQTSLLMSLCEAYIDRFNKLLAEAKLLYPAEKHIMDMTQRVYTFVSGSYFEFQIHDVRMATEQLLDTIVEYEKTSGKEMHPDESQGTPVDLFKSLDFHPRIKKASFKLFADGHYPQSVFEAFKALNIYVKNKSERADLDGKTLMTEVFSPKRPILQLNPLQNTSDENEQMGFMLLFAGSMVGIRNPEAHEIVQQSDPEKAAIKYTPHEDVCYTCANESCPFNGLHKQNEVDPPSDLPFFAFYDSKL